MGRSNFVMLALLSFSKRTLVFGLAIMPIRPSLLVSLPTPISGLTSIEQLNYRENGLESLAHNPSRPYQKESDSIELLSTSESHAVPEKRDDSESIQLEILDYMHINITSNNSTNERLFQEPARLAEVILSSDEDNPRDRIPCKFCGGSPHQHDQHESSDNMNDDLKNYFDFLERQLEDIERHEFEKREEQAQKEGLPPHNEWPPKDFIYDPDPSEPDFEDTGCLPGMTCAGPNMKRPAQDLDDDTNARCTSMFC